MPLQKMSEDEISELIKYMKEFKIGLSTLYEGESKTLMKWINLPVHKNCDKRQVGVLENL